MNSEKTDFMCYFYPLYFLFLQSLSSYSRAVDAVDPSWDAPRIKNLLHVEVTHHFANAYRRLVNRERTFECVIRRAQTFATVCILNDVDDEEAVLKKAGRPSSRRTLENSRSTGMKSTLRYLIINVALPLFSLFKAYLNFIDRKNSRT